MKNRKAFICIFILAIVVVSFFYGNKARAGTLSCSVTTAAGCTGTIIYRMSGASDAHLELPTQSTAAYDGNVVCCTGVAGLDISCSGVFDTVLKLSGVTNAHAEQNSQSLYANSACMSVPNGGSVLVDYQESNCNGFDTTLGSMWGTTNAHVGDGTAYTTKICASASGALGTLSADIVDSDGTLVVNPSVSFGTAGFSFNTQTSTGILGVSTQKIRLSNTTSAPAWTLSVAATSGPTTLWTTGSTTYDFNSTAASGRLTVDPSVATITPQGGCSSTGISLGSSTAFNQGVTDSITLATTSGATQANCYWDFINIGLTQDIPAQQSAGTYTINLTLTVA